LADSKWDKSKHKMTNLQHRPEASKNMKWSCDCTCGILRVFADTEKNVKKEFKRFLNAKSHSG
jgi:hypothetical protein